MQIQLIVVPYDSGRRAYRMGAGPEHLLRSGLADELGAHAHVLTTRILETSLTDPGDAAFDLAGQIAAATRSATSNSAFPMILAGNCIATLGGFAGLGSKSALLWLDAHADFNTPDTSPSGFLDGMALSVITGRCHTERTSDLAGFSPLPDDRLLMMGTRSVDEGERAPLAAVRRVTDVKKLARMLGDLDVDDIYLHIDLDVLDANAARANCFAEPGGLSEQDIVDVVRIVKETKRLRGAALTAYDPSEDPRAEGIAKRIVTAVIGT